MAAAIPKNTFTSLPAQMNGVGQTAIAVVRHLKTIYNQEERFSTKTKKEGGGDSGILPDQEKILEQTYDILKANGFFQAPTTVLQSPFQRTQDTARLLTGFAIHDGWKGDIQTSEELRELSAPSLEGQEFPNFGLTGSKFSKSEWLRKFHIHTHENGGESYEDVKSRTLDIFNRVLKQTPQGGRVVFVTHGGVARALLDELLGVAEQNAHDLGYGQNKIAFVNV